MNDLRPVAQVLAIVSFATIFFVGFLEGYTGNYIAALDPLVTIFALIFMGSLAYYFYYEGKETKKKQEVNLIIMTLIIALYAWSFTEWIALLITVLPFLLGRWKRD